MSNEDDYDAILNKSFSDLQDDKLLPDGKWVLRGRNAAYMAPKEEGQSARLLFFYTPVEATDDVDAGALEDLGEDYDVAENQIVFQVWIEGNRSWKAVFQHMKKHSGVDFEAGDGTIRDVLKKGFKGSEVVAEIASRTYENDFDELVSENTAKKFFSLED